MLNTEEIKRLVENHRPELIQAADRIWEFAEERFSEFRSCSLQMDILKNHGFAVSSPCSTLPTAFMADMGAVIRLSGFSVNTMRSRACSGRLTVFIRPPKRLLPPVQKVADTDAATIFWAPAHWELPLRQKIIWTLKKSVEPLFITAVRLRRTLQARPS